MLLKIILVIPIIVITSYIIVKQNLYEQFSTEDLKKQYQDIIKDPDLYIPKKELIKPLKYEKKELKPLEYPYEVVKPKEGIDLKKINNSNLSNLTMYEQSINLIAPSYMYNEKETIEDPISDSYLPYSQNISESIKTPEDINYEYNIISIFKNVLNRNPTLSEVKKYTQQFKDNELDETLLRINLLNTSEYKRNIKLQSNDISSYIDYTIAKEDLLAYINKIYFLELGQEAPKLVLLPLRDIYVYLQNNEYLFRAMLINNNYKKFEQDIINTKLLTKLNLANLFNKYFILYELKLKANDIKKTEILKRKGKIINEPLELSSDTKLKMTDIAKLSLEQNFTTKIIENIINNTKNVYDLGDLNA